MRLLPVVIAALATAGTPDLRNLGADDVVVDPTVSGTLVPGDVAPFSETPVDKPKQRQREGVKLSDRRGRFERRGERYVFLSDAPVGHFMVLENLMLERVANVLADAAGGQLRWSVTGTVTEFRGVNFLLLDRAVVKASQDDGELQRRNDSQTKTTFRTRSSTPVLR
jgi:hypothetical protein